MIGVFLECYLRSLAREPIPVTIAPDARANAKAFVEPDFLWAGKAWWIDVEADVPIVLDIDGTWSAVVPPGSHSIYANHDHNNVREFSADSSWTTPKQILVREHNSEDDSAKAGE